MKKLIYGGLFLALVGIVFVGCKKEESKVLRKQNSHDSKLTTNEQKFLSDLKITIKQKSSNFVYTKSTEVDPSFQDNPYDYIGSNHNSQLNELHNNPNYNDNPIDVINLFNDLNSKKGHPLYNNSEQVLSDINYYKSEVFTEQNNISNDWINSLSSPFFEKQTLKLYFLSVSSSDNLQLRIAISKVIESAVKESPFYSSESKRRLLTLASIFRYSSSYWTDFGNSTPQEIDIFSKFDAAIAERCMDGTYMPDGYDVSCSGIANQVGSLYSAVFRIMVFGI